MKSGYCIQGGDNTAMHAKCTDPARCTCDCHGRTPARPIVVAELETFPGPLTCPTCEQTFGSRQALGSHSKAHNKRVARPGEHKCEHCGREFLAAPGLASHARRCNPTTPAPRPTPPPRNQQRTQLHRGRDRSDTRRPPGDRHAPRTTRPGPHRTQRAHHLT